MQVVRTLDDVATVTAPLVVAVGVFDGVHLGHQQVIRLAREQAAREGASPWVMTFHPHPLEVVQPALTPPLLTRIPDRLDLFRDHGVDGVIIVPFDQAFSEIEPEAFLDHLVARIPDLRGVVIGENWRFGRQARGNVDLLRTLAARYQFHVTVAPPVAWDGGTLSSTRIRDAVARGDLDACRAMLGRPHAVRGPVIHGMKRGRRLGFPTANLDVTGCAIPPSGIYAARVHIDGTAWDGALYRPAHPELQHGLLEVHLIGYEGDLYDRMLHVEWMTKIREDNLRFEAEDALIEQIADDVRAIRAALAAPEEPV
jgi:riboflavin kinase/FMN adenylyltransferase